MNRLASLKEMLLAAFLFGVIPLLQTKLTFDPSQHLQFTFLSAGLFVYWLIFNKPQLRFSFNNRVSKILLLSLSGYLLYSMVSVAMAGNLADAFYVFIKTGLYFVLLLTFAWRIKGPNTLKNISIVWYLLSSVILVTGYIQVLTLLKNGQLSIPHSTYHLTAIFAHRNLLAETLAFSLPFLVYQFFTTQKSWLKAGTTINLSLTFILLILLSNRTSWLAVIAAALTIVSLMAIKRRFLFKTKGFKQLSMVLLISVAAGSATAYYFADKTSLIHHISTSFNPGEGSTKDRLKLWDRSVKLIAEKPIFGHGLDTWKIEMLKFGSKDYEAVKGEVFYQRPHNDFLWVLAEQGIIGGSLYLLFFLSLLVLAFVTYIRSSNKEDRYLALVVGATMVLYACFSMLSFPKEIIFHNILLFSMTGALINRNIQPSSNHPAQVKPAHFLVLTLLAVALISGSFRLYGEIHTKKALKYRKTNQPHDCIRHINKAQSAFYNVDATSTPIDWYAGAAWFQLKDHKKAERHFEKAYRLNPYHLFVTNDYAGSLFKNGQTNEAIQKYLEVIALAPGHLDSRLNLCALYFNQNRLTKAFEIMPTQSQMKSRTDTNKPCK